MPREYRLKKRALQQEETRQRIIDAALQLYEAYGSETTLTDIADRAGVGRVTLYRHFPDERALLVACAGSWFEQHPPPDPVTWAEIADPEERLRTALGDLYAFYRQAEPILSRVALRGPGNPLLGDPHSPLAVYQAGMRAVLATGWGGNGADAATRVAVIGHALAFSTWQSLVREQGLDEERAIALLVRMARDAAKSAPA